MSANTALRDLRKKTAPKIRHIPFLLILGGTIVVVKVLKWIFGK